MPCISGLGYTLIQVLCQVLFRTKKSDLVWSPEGVFVWIQNFWLVCEISEDEIKAREVPRIELTERCRDKREVRGNIHLFSLSVYHARSTKVQCATGVSKATPTRHEYLVSCSEAVELVRQLRYVVTGICVRRIE